MAQSVKMFMGIFMVLFYIGIGILVALNVIQWTETPFWNGVRWFMAVVLIAYGLFRGYREITGKHAYGMRVYDDEENEDEKYMTYAERLKQLENNNDEEKK